MDELSVLAKYGIDTSGIRRNIEKIYSFSRPWIKTLYEENFDIDNIGRLLLFRSMSAYANILNEKLIVYSVKLNTRYELEASGETVLFNTIIANIYCNAETETVEYIVCGPSYNSADGEYRNGLIRFDTFLAIFVTETIAALNPIYEILTKYINKNVYTIVLEGSHKSKKIEKELTKHNVLLKILALTSLFLNRASQSHILANNFSDGYVESLRNPEIVSFIRDSKDEIMNIELMYIFRYFTKFYYAPGTTNYNLISGELGVKTIPLTHNTLKNKQNLSVNIWREIFVSQLVTNAVLNYITPGLPMTGSYAILDGMDQRFFNNTMQKIKYEYSDLVTDVIYKLEELRADLYSWDDKNKEEIYLSVKSEMLGKYINVPISFAKQEMIFTDKSLLMITEYCNFTIADLPFSIYYNERTKSLGPVFLREDVFKKYVFEIIYTLYCLNNRFDIIHSDLHMNNICMKEEGNPSKNALVVPRYVIYDIHGRLFKFNQFTRYSVIIDFSRALVGEKITADFSEEIRQKIQQDQKNRIKKAISENFPDLYNLYENEISSLLTSKYQKVYDIFKAIDCYKVGKNLGHMINAMVETPDLASPRVDYKLLKEKYLPFLENIRDVGYNYFYNYLISMIKNIPIEVKNPNLYILQTLFTDFELPADYLPPTINVSPIKSNPDIEEPKTEIQPEKTKKTEKYTMDLAGYFCVDNNIFYKNEYGSGPGELRLTEEQLKTINKENHLEKLQLEMENEEDKKMEKIRKHAQKFTEEQLEKSKKYYYDT